MFKEAKALAKKMGISRNQLFSRAVVDFVRQAEKRELLERLNAAHADGLDGDEKELFERMRVYQGRLLNRLEGEW